MAAAKLQPQAVPNGGWLGYSQVLACFCISMCSLGIANSFGIFQLHYQTSLLSSFPPSTIAWIGTSQGFLVNAIGLLSGRLYDAGYARTLVYIGSILNTAGLVAASFSSTYPQIFLSLGLCVGLGSGAMYVPSLAIVTTYFDSRKRPLATGIAATGAGVGGVVYPVLFRTLIERVGFAWAVRSFACVNGGLLLLSSLLVRPLPAASIADLSAAVTTTAANIPLEKKPLFDLTVFYDRRFALFSLALFLLWLGVDVPFFFLPSFASSQVNLSAEWGDHLLAIMNASAIVGRVLLGLAAVYLGSFAVWQASIGASCVLLACWMAVTSLPAIITFAILYGGFTGAVISLVPAALVVISPDLSVVGTRLGMCSVLAGFGFLIGPPAAGAIQATPGGYAGQGGFAAGAYLAAFGVLWVVMMLQRRELKNGERESKPEALRVMLVA